MIKRLTPQALAGVNPIVAMPFTPQGAVDVRSFISMVEHLTATGCQGITLFGIASEFYKLTDDEKTMLAGLFVEMLTDSTVYSCISVTDHATEVAVSRARYYEQLGADSLMLLAPFFLKPTTTQVTEHICAVLEAVSVPVLVQYAPGETGLNIPPEAMAKISYRYPHAVFKVECNPPVEYTQALLAAKPDAVVLNGYAGLYMLDMLEAGGHGVMPGCSFTEVYVAIYRLFEQGEKAQARQLHKQLLTFIQRWMSHCEYIIKVEKQILAARGIIRSDYCRQPDYDSESSVEDVSVFLAQFGQYLEGG